MNLSEITPLVLTWNESPNIARCLEHLQWAEQVMVLDSGSTDDTATLARNCANVNFLVRPFDNHTNQWNYGLDQIRTRWVLSLDADYLLPISFVDELSAMQAADSFSAYFASFRYLIHGRPLRASLYPPRAVLYQRRFCNYVPDGHTQRLSIQGPSSRLRSRIDHDDRKPLSRWIQSQAHYAELEAEKLLASNPASLSLPDRLRKHVFFAAPATLAYTLFIKRALLDGKAGWHYVLQRTFAELLLSLRLLEIQARSSKSAKSATL